MEEYRDGCSEGRIGSGRGIEKTLEETVNRTDAAIHLHPLKARELIRNGAYIALKKFMENRNPLKSRNRFKRLMNWLPDSVQAKIVR